MSSLEHSPTPWFITQAHSGTYIAKEGGGLVAQAIDGYCTDLEEARADAAFIVKAANSYEANQTLIAKLTEALEQIREECNNDGKWSEIVMERMIERIELEAVSALSIAKSETPQ